MELLGKLGIDIKLLVAQIVNFGLLLIVLDKLLYKPLIKKIEEDEEKMRQVEKREEELKREKEEFMRLKQREIIEARRDVQEMIKDAKEMANRIQEKARIEIEKEKARIIKQAKKSIEDYQKDIYNQIQKDIRNKTIQTLKIYFSSLDEELLIKWHNLFFQKLLLNLEIVELPKISSYDIKNIKQKKDKTNRERIDKFLEKKIGPIFLEYALPLSLKQKKELSLGIAKRLGLKGMLKIRGEENKELIVGFRLEIGGVLIECNLLSEIERIVYKTLKGG